MEIKDLIRQLGGTGEVARTCDVTDAAVSQWIKAGVIPARRVFAVWAMARERGVDWTPPGVPAAAKPEAA